MHLPAAAHRGYSVVMVFVMSSITLEPSSCRLLGHVKSSVTMRLSSTYSRR